jgi:hypothetical protein
MAICRDWLSVTRTGLTLNLEESLVTGTFERDDDSGGEEDVEVNFLGHEVMTPELSRRARHLGVCRISPPPANTLLRQKSSVCFLQVSTNRNLLLGTTTSTWTVRLWARTRSKHHFLPLLPKSKILVICYFH